MGKSKTVILVTGATGQAGAEVCAQLLRYPEIEIRGGLHSPAKKDQLPDGVIPVPFDTDEPSTVQAALAGVDRLFLLTPGGPGGPAATRVILDAVEGSGVERIVRLSSIDPELEPQSPTDLWALETEAMVRATGLPATFLRPTWLFQNFSKGYFLPMLLQRTLALPFADGRAGWIDGRDVGAVGAAALVEDGHEGRTYTLTGPEAISLHELAAAFSKAAGREIRYIPLSDEQWIEALAATGSPREVALATLALMAKTRDGLGDKITDDVERVIGRKPHSVTEFCSDHRELLESLTR